MTKKTKQGNIYRYFILTFIVSWGLWSPFYFSIEISEFWVLPGAWGPTIAAIILTYAEHGKSGIKKLLRKLLIWKIPFRYYLFAIFALLGIGLCAIALHSILGGTVPDPNIILKGMGLSEGQFGIALVLLPLFFLINTLLGGPIAEELGWRGYAQEVMQQQYNPNVSGLFIGFFWSLWHLPLILFFPKAVGYMSIWAYIPLMTAMGVIFSWLYNHTKGSVLLAIVLHGGMNFTHGFLGAKILGDKALLAIQISFVILLAILLSRNNVTKIKTKRAIHKV